ncbi:synaptic vesicle glycoprotein 2A isoform X3 [Lates japonicus]|uniref:Synaptic vesicle glycoprotein 2A isoform X3 n=1 Tax=Lates japonicus TaxID=270547 RepID=A0AAD3NLM3_LATJO|nr:synaptic vesicle glycoprotein 2A isoform X3 [Lates japonicus]
MLVNVRNRQRYIHALSFRRSGESRWLACLVYRRYPGSEASVMPLSSHLLSLTAGRRRRYYGLTVWFPDMIKYLQKQEYE